MTQSTVGVHPDGTSSDTTSWKCVPIVFVPGVMGTRLAMASAGRTWDPDTGGLMADWIPFTIERQRTNRRALSPRASPATILTTLSDNAEQGVILRPGLTLIRNKMKQAGLDVGRSLMSYYGVTRNWGTVAWGFYGEMLMVLEERFNQDLEHPVFAFGYDWRGSCADSGNAFAAFASSLLRQYAATAEDIVVVTHSMGGLVVRAGLFGAPDLDTKIRGVVHGAQPSNGAVVCYRRFFTGAIPGLDGWLPTPQVLSRIQGSAPEEYAYNLSGAPGPLQLLPNHLFGQSVPDWLTSKSGPIDLADIYSIYARYEWPGLRGPTDLGQAKLGTDAEIAANSIVGDLLHNLDAAHDFHHAIASTWHRNTLVLYSTGVTTDAAAHFGAYRTPTSFAAAVNPGAFLSIEGDVSPISPEALAPPPRWTAPTWGLPGGSSDLEGLQQGQGDGTVPEQSGTCPGCTESHLAAPAIAVRGIEHADVYKNAHFRDQASVFVKMLFAVSPGASIK
jgi:hypothetical protein